MAMTLEMKSKSGSQSDNRSDNMSSIQSGDEFSLVSIKAGCFKSHPGSEKGRRCQMIQMLVLVFIPVITLLIQNTVILCHSKGAMDGASFINGQISVTVEVEKLLSQVQAERSAVAYAIYSRSNNTRKHLTAATFVATDLIMAKLSNLVDNEILSGKDISLQNHWLAIKDRREHLLNLTGSQKTINCDDAALEEMIWYNQANDLILDQLSRKIRETNTGLWRYYHVRRWSLVAYRNMIKTIENYSISMVYGFFYFCKGHLSNRSLARYVRYDSLAENYLNSTLRFSEDVFEKYQTFYIDFDAYDNLRGFCGHNTSMLSSQFHSDLECLVTFLFANENGRRQAEIYENVEKQPRTTEAENYYVDMTNYIKLLRSYQTHLRQTVITQIYNEMYDAKYQLAWTAVILGIVSLVSPIIILLVKSVTEAVQKYSAILSKKTRALNIEKKKSDRLLNQMLPTMVVKELRQRRQVVAEQYESVTIYFSDIVNFTRLSSTSSPMEIVIMLNSLYQLFDSRIEHYDVYKVETIGDAYMVVSGLPLRNGLAHAGEICTMALDLIYGVQIFKIPHRPSESLTIRVGINTGPCVAGVIGTKMPRYCLFGDSINTASRMESNGEAMKIHIAEDTKIVLDVLGGFTYEHRGLIQIKGKGLMNTYWLTGKDGGVPRSIEMTTPGFLKTIVIPEFVREMFGDENENDGEARESDE